MSYEPDPQMLNVAIGYIEPPKTDELMRVLYTIVHLLDEIKAAL